ncbi:phage tail tape measure protein [Aurantimonas sp. LRZ36]|uniref:Phage tail tape measure protein n=2 Tax=Aurantimonas marianensis TaxID=2920428 RepID=A0A9X2HAJ3_9HYPH|nr:phage tail tape measure protein [Aurantimonas marianensis]MCP3054842.1 phage tail tape measure protein [Aurantimonas marianensis]
MGDLTQRANAFGSAISSALKAAATGGRSFDSVLRQLGQRISAIALDAALRPLTNIASSFIGKAVGGLTGALTAPVPTGVLPFAKGGVVAAPSFFPAGGKLGLMGEAGAEAILPLKRGADGTLGVATPAAGAGPSIVFNVTTPDAASFKRSEAQIQAMLARAASRGRRGV